ncbi:V4R domain-containing protein [Methanococcoides burtonii]|uniref:Protein with 4-vinyl reductase domain and helix-turn-helix motif n=1 Tax=Methanococcoides burtonii (strain DSM 6242 / NBRC 107633 / OCM 468 / ACE-M) TaxID=259564 RepID=Q12Y49_METBU|nr:V4R domain-containing protein [Methanococcoides burtonii]ABE51627.1 Protein with 4-vinyl reductase domain and helix-turn-helix motif [Methanococcoides burtonii DSM 6242]
MEPDGQTALFSTQNGIIAIEGPVKLQIMELLYETAQSFDDIVKHTGKAKSTISVHLKDLKASNLLEEHVDPDDRRKKTYVMCSQYTACSQKPVFDHYRKNLEEFTTSFDSEGGLLRSMFRTVQSGFHANGFNQTPIMENIGQDIGMKIAETFTSTYIEGLFEEVTDYWQKNEMGKLTVRSYDPLIINIKDSFICEGTKNIGQTLCSFNEGILQGIILNKMNLQCNIVETECCGTGHGHCLFVMQ